MLLSVAIIWSLTKYTNKISESVQHLPCRLRETINKINFVYIINFLSLLIHSSLLFSSIIIHILYFSIVIRSIFIHKVFYISPKLLKSCNQIEKHHILESQQGEKKNKREKKIANELEPKEDIQIFHFTNTKQYFYPYFC